VQVTTTPKKGDVVTFSYEIHARRELPFNPNIIRIRMDLSWEDVVAGAFTEKKHLNGIPFFFFFFLFFSFLFFALFLYYFILFVVIP
jgi:hypothetical protein